MEIKYYKPGEINNEKFQFAIISASYKGKWIFVRNKERVTWEIPGGHREVNENINATASRELYEESGATDFEIEPVCDYTVTIGETTTYGRLFYAKVNEFGPLPDSEIGEIKLSESLPEHLTYAEIQPRLLRKVLQHLSDKTSL